MKKKRNYLAYISVGLALLGSAVTFYASNLLLSDVSNMFYEKMTEDVITSLPVFFIAVYFLMGFIFCQRLAKRPEYFRSICIWYIDLFTFVSMIGIGASVASGSFIYGSYTLPYPFPGATIICLVIHIIVFFVSGFFSTWIKENISPDKEKRKLKPSYCLYSFVLAVATFLAFNRFGAVLFMPCYVQLRTLNLTWPFYVFSLMPMALLWHISMYNFKLDRKYPNIGVISSILIFVLNLVMGVVVLYLGRKYTLFVAAISPALAIERLLTMPVDIIAEFVLVTLIGIYEIVHAVKKRNRKHRLNGAC